MTDTIESLNDYEIADRIITAFEQGAGSRAQRVNLASKILNRARALGPELQKIDTAPKDGTRILLFCVHPNAGYCKKPHDETWAGFVIGSWIKHNGGGWCWNGHMGQVTHWAHLPKEQGQ